MTFWYTRRFLHLLKKLPHEVQEDVFGAIDRFKNPTHHAGLRLHKLSGQLKKYHAFSANFSYRIIIKINEKNIYFIAVGDHDVYQ